MSEVLHLPESDCARALVWIAGLMDGDLASDQSAWLLGHLERCAECRIALARFAEIDKELTGWGQRLGRENPPPAAAREQLSARLARSSRRQAGLWIPAAAATIAAALALAVIVPPEGPPAGSRAANHTESPFIQIPYLAPLDPRENTTVVRMNVSVATLIAVGYRVTADPDAMVPADVLVGEDGRAHAVRVLSDIDWNGTGD
jgi:hypothetical protein